MCESRYTSKLRNFKKIKVWSLPRNTSVQVSARAQPLSPVRVASVFASSERGASPAPPDLATDVLDKLRQEVEQFVDPSSELATPGFRFFEQLQVAAGWLKLGMFVHKKHK